MRTAAARRGRSALAIDKRPLDAQAADALREEIVRGRIAAGSRLTEQELAGAMGLSRGTVRAALAQLLRDGLVTLVPYTGWAVRELGADDVWELYTLRASLEGLGARLAATRADAASVAAIERTFAGLVDACAERDATAMADRDFALHAGIIAAAAHSRLAEQYRTVEHQVRMFIISSDALITDPHELVEQHRPLVDAIAAGDPLRAEAEAVLHNTREGEKLVAHLQRPATAGLVDA